MSVERRSPTLRDVAEHAHVSSATASRALRGDSSVSEEAATRVLAAAAELGYQPRRSSNLGASGGWFRHARSSQLNQQWLAPRIVVVTDDVEEESFSEIIGDVTAAAAKEGVSTFVSSYGGNPQPQLLVLQLLRTLRPMGLVLAGDWLEEPDIADELAATLSEHAAAGGRVVLLNSQTFAYHSVRFDDLAAGTAIGRHMAGLGRNRAVILAGEKGIGVYTRRVEGILAGFADSEVSDVRIIHSPSSRSGAAKALGSALDERSADLVVAVCDRLALGANIELTRRGVSVPGEVALSGLGDVAIARRLTPSLTTYSLPFASAAADIARLILFQEGDALRSVELRGELVVRESSTPTSGTSAG